MSEQNERPDYGNIDPKMNGASDPVEFFTTGKIAQCGHAEYCGLTREGWYFWDESGSIAHGPYDSEDLCRHALYAYGQTLW